MAQPVGNDLIVALYEETTYKTDPGTPSGMKMFVSSFGLVPQQNLIDSAVFSGKRTLQAPMKGNKNMTGPMETELAAEWMARPLKHLLGTNTITGTGPYTHTIKIGALPVGMTLEKDFGSALGASDRYEKFNGCKFASGTFRFPVEGPCTAGFQITGAKYTAPGAVLDATLDDHGHTSFSSFDASLDEGGSAISVVQSGEFTYSNNLDESLFVIGGAGERRALRESRATVSGSIVTLFETRALLDKALNHTTSSLKFKLTRGDGLGSAGNEYMEFFLQNLKYELSGTPVNGPLGLLVTLNFRTFRSGTDEGLQIVVKNAVSAA